MKKLSTLLTIISISISLCAGVFTPAPAHPSYATDNLQPITYNFQPTIGAVMIFDREIKPFIKTKFEEDISDEYLIVQRKLLKVQLYRVEVIDGRDVYSVHIEFAVRMKEKDSGDERTTLRGQETLFLIKNGKIEDIVPFDEYVTETDEKEIKEKLNSASPDKRLRGQASAE